MRQAITKKAHQSLYSVQPGRYKMYQDLKYHCWWLGIKRDLTEYVSKCLTCQQVKAEHQVSSGLLHPVVVLEWKWDSVKTDFMSELPNTQRKHDAICVIVDKLTKLAQFLPIR